uniref:Uncharacterized protein n=1 Tax=Anguilla anguilla TaxID=7936 RepID=A0A0E9TU50_ANGAN
MHKPLQKWKSENEHAYVL